jgi:RHS repeat-associated protein
MIFSGTGVSGDYYFPLHDHLGSVRVVVDTGANVVESYDYYPFGAEQRSRVNANQNAGLRFTGKELDKESHLGLYYFGARYYDPEVGRFIGVDPLAEEYPGWSPYVYCLNNPLKNIDPDGREVVLGSWLERTVNKVTGYKTDNLKRLEGVVDRLNSTETGRALYNDLDSRKEIVNIDIKDNLTNKQGDNLNGLTSPKGDPKGSKATGVDILIDPNSANTDVRNAGLKNDDGAVTTLGHEMGHAKSSLDDLQKYTKEYKDGTACKNQAEPYEKKIREEIKKQYKEDEKTP